MLPSVASCQKNIGDQGNKAPDDKYPTQLANIPAQIAHNTGYAAVKTKRSKITGIADRASPCCSGSVSKFTW
ncbi:Uncharacterised protein [Klebsiella michiganensis]|uniref:Uncharacterized protein n=1 Tax=Klebsiella michiganensis TaxID=1134687 RepID=A0A7H4PJZ8_9ENTR|nr:Uncharacterised protein [Klebsiella michiganensis]